MNTFKEFDALNVPLEKKNLVEASAGTGKTFSIAVMVLRLILEKDINIREILLVTFTNNAVAELDERIRLFLRSAHEYANSGKGATEVIRAVVDRQIAGIGKEAAIKKLNESLLFLDETSVLTIHSFCHQTLSNLAFETGQLFESELVTNLDEVVMSQVQEFWRNEIVTLPVEILSMLSGIGFNQDAIVSIVSNYLSGKRYHSFHEKITYQPGKECAILLPGIQKLETSCQEYYGQLQELFFQNKDHLREVLETDRFEFVFVEHLDDFDSFLSMLSKRRTRKGVARIFPDEMLTAFDQLSETQEAIKQEGSKFADLLYCSALEKVIAGVSHYCDTKGIQSFDSLIKNLYNALQGTNREKIIRALKRQYRAVFIDEFQDTDKWQYDIFLESFGKDVILFLIGDPKQSIYAFRQADINTYFKAYQDADNRYNMNVNFRSSNAMIDSMNEFFMPQPGFDFFYFQKAANSIYYFLVSSPEKNTKGYFVTDEIRDNGITICSGENRDDLLKIAAYRVFRLLTESRYGIETDHGKRKIVPADIGILVKNKDYGHELKQHLGKFNIPSVFVADEKIMKTQEARDLIRLISAIYDPSVENINAALVNSFTGYKSKDAISFDAEYIIELFKGYKQTWELQSIYSCIAAFISDFGIENYLRDPGTPNGLRIITNLYQLMELLQKTAYHQHLKQAELLSWYKRALELDLMEKDESTIRLESDADAVTIMTIHKSKGLQFNIVIAPQMDFKEPDNRELVELYENNEYITIPKKELNEDQKSNFKTQTEQEFRRLMYVTITRAVYKTFIFHNAGKYYNGSALSQMLPLLQNASHIEISDDEMDTSAIDYSQKYQGQKNEHPVPAMLKNKFRLKDPFWRYMSYSRLAAKESFVIPQQEVPKTAREDAEYDEFIFRKLRKGNITGNMVHYIFERIDFGDTSQHAFIIPDAVNRFASSNAESYNQWLPTFADHVLHGTIHTETTSFQLAEIHSNLRISEMEFDFSTIQCDPAQLTAALRDAGLGIQLRGNEPLHGLMKGFIDLLFEHKGKYYILDWKTNFLGGSLADYEHAALNEAMEQLNYQLQFVIYTLAVKKYLLARLGHFDYDRFGGVIYCFVRGMRKGTRNGVYFHRPEESAITKIEMLLAPATPVAG